LKIQVFELLCCVDWQLLFQIDIVPPQFLVVHEEPKILKESVPFCCVSLLVTLYLKQGLKY